MRLFIGFCTLWLTLLAVANADTDDYKVVCYYTYWSSYWSGSANFNISDIDSSLCTHMIYAYADIDAEGNISPGDASEDLADNGGADGYGRFVALKENNTDLKTIISVGGWSQGSVKFSTIANNETLRATFISNALDYVNTYGFDGIDIDWQHPTLRGGIPADVENFVTLLQELHDVFEATGLLVSCSVGANIRTANPPYNVTGVSDNVDFINMITFTYHSAKKDNVTGHNSPLYISTRDTAAADQLANVNSSVHYWLDQGAAASKLIVGTPGYGKSFTLTDSSDHVPGSPISGNGVAGETNEIGALPYFQICDDINNNGWTEVYDEEQHVPYAYSGDQWVSFENAASMTEKANYIVSLGLGGVGVWAIDRDDAHGVCGTKYPLLTALNDVLRA